MRGSWLGTGGLGPWMLVRLWEGQVRPGKCYLGTVRNAQFQGGSGALRGGPSICPNENWVVFHEGEICPPEKGSRRGGQASPS